MKGRDNVGVKSVRNFKVNDIVCIIPGHIVEDDEVAPDEEKYAFRWEDGRSFVPNKMDTLYSPNSQGIFINEGKNRYEDVNVIASTVRNDSHTKAVIELIACRKIKSGDEILMDYGDAYMFYVKPKSLTMLHQYKKGDIVMIPSGDRSCCISRVLHKQKKSNFTEVEDVSRGFKMGLSGNTRTYGQLRLSEDSRGYRFIDGVSMRKFKELRLHHPFLGYMNEHAYIGNYACKNQLLASLFSKRNITCHKDKKQHIAEFQVTDSRRICTGDSGWKAMGNSGYHFHVQLFLKQRDGLVQNGLANYVYFGSKDHEPNCRILKVQSRFFLILTKSVKEGELFICPC